MQAKEAIVVAKHYVADVFADEGIANLGLEEVEHDEGQRVWRITLGFSRPWDTALKPLFAVHGETVKRSYKVVTLRDEDGRVLSVKQRDTSE